MEQYVPDLYQKNVHTIKYDKLVKRGIKCILFDIDNTLVSIDTKDIDDKLAELFNKIKTLGLKPIIYCSNSRRLNIFKDALEVDGCNDVCKKITDILNEYKEDEVALIGDEMLTDINIGNKLGITTILVNPIGKDAFFKHFKRGKEKRIMTKLRNNNLFVKGRYYE